ARQNIIPSTDLIEGGGRDICFLLKTYRKADLSTVQIYSLIGISTCPCISTVAVFDSEHIALHPFRQGHISCRFLAVQPVNWRKVEIFKSIVEKTDSIYKTVFTIGTENYTYKSHAVTGGGGDQSIFGCLCMTCFARYDTVVMIFAIVDKGIRIFKIPGR